MQSKYKIAELKSLSKSTQQSQDALSQIKIPESDNTVDESRYLIGGGDKFFISFLDRTSLVYFGTVNPHGDLYVPSLGLFKLGKIPLCEAKRKIIEELRVKYKNADSIYVSLHSPKNVTVYVRGIVKNPGRFTLPGTMRILDAIKIASDFDITQMKDIDFRNIICSNTDTTIIYDVYKYMVAGDASENPYLYGGDHIGVEALTKRIMLVGAISSLPRGIIPIKEGETVLSLLSLFKLDAAADTSFVILKRQSESGAETIVKVPSTSFAEQKLDDRDVVHIPVKKNHPDMMLVTVSGHVERPGMYPVCKRGTTAKEILDLAGLLPEAAGKRIAVLRSSKEIKQPIIPQERNMFITSLPQSFSRSEMNNAISLMMTAKDYTVIPLSATEDIELEDEDEIVVPKSESLVYISGAVERPGGYPFVEGKKMSYYIRLAGGLNRFADRQNIYRMIKYGDVMQFSNSDEIGDGDVIVVPFAKENKFFNNIVMPFFSMFATTVTLVIAIISVMK